MEKELLKFIDECALTPFVKNGSAKIKTKQIFKTKDARSVHTRTLGVIEKKFVFNGTDSLLNYFDFPESSEEIFQRQKYFQSLRAYSRDFLKELKEPRPNWNPDYGIVVVTEEDSTFRALKEMGCAVKFIINESDVLELERYDVVQVIDCENFARAIERLPQSVFLKSVDEAYLERHVRTLSGWKPNLEVMKDKNLPDEIKNIVSELASLVSLCNNRKSEKLNREKVEDVLETIREEISFEVKKMSLSGDSLLLALNKGTLPNELRDVVERAVRKTGVPENIFVKTIPVSIDERELENFLRNQSLNEFANSAHEIKLRAKEIVKIPEQLRRLESLLILFDFESAICEWMNGKKFPTVSKRVYLEEGKNEFLENPTPIKFFLDDSHKCSILTGANSGGKTTLIEHLIQVISYTYIGLPVEGNFEVPIFEEIYYFAKNKGSASKGAFETLLTQLSEVRPGDKTLILADEIEAVTEPGVAGKMIAASAEFFIEKGCFLVFATHLGQEIQKMLPSFARIDGIEARGLDKNNELIVDHNPVIGRLASSTPELIVEKMAKTTNKEYFRFLDGVLKKN